MDYEKKYKETLERAKQFLRTSVAFDRFTIERVFPELKENKMEWIEKIRQELKSYLEHREVKQISESDAIHQWIARLEKQGSEPNWYHHKVDLSDCSEEYRKAYYDGWNNCNMQHSQYKSESNDVVKCLINGMKFYYEDNEEATWGTEKFSMKVKDILSWLEKQGEQNPYSGISFKYNGHTWGMCARDGGVEILVDGEIKERVFLDNKPQGKTVFEAIKEEKVDNQNCVKSADKVNPKFKVGDWICNDMCDVHIASIEDGMYYFDEGDGLSIVFVDEHYHLWTIEDAMDGDVLCVKYGNDEMPFIFTGKQHDVAYCALNSFGEFVLSMAEWLLKVSVLPANKEQRDLLFQKMKEAGYVWDSEKKELRKVEQNPTAWSDEDERNMQNIDSVLFYDRKLPEDTCVKLRNFLKTLKQRCI